MNICPPPLPNTDFLRSLILCNTYVQAVASFAISCERVNKILCEKRTVNHSGTVDCECRVYLKRFQYDYIPSFNFEMVWTFYQVFLQGMKKYQVFQFKFMKMIISFGYQLGACMQVWLNFNDRVCLFVYWFYRFIGLLVQCLFCLLVQIFCRVIKQSVSRI